MTNGRDSRLGSPIDHGDASSGLVLAWKSGSVIYSAAPAELVVPDCPFDLISFLAVAQKLEIDILPITWQPALDAVGRGGTAEIRQLFINLQMSFVFKRVIWPESGLSEEIRTLQASISEVRILGHPSIRSHPNIIRLQGVCWDIAPGNENDRLKVWPVLVFEKVKYGDLNSFLKSDTAHTLCLEDRLMLCADIASAVMTMHTCRAIHGDIKPENVLISREHSGRYIAKVTDFGYSFLALSEDAWIKMPRSKPWYAPEWHHRGIRLSEAMKMDVFSFGLLCLWLLFKEDEMFPKDSGPTSLDDLKSEDGLKQIAHDLVRVASLDDQQRSRLDKFFELSLPCDPRTRISDFKALLQLLDPNRIPPPAVESLERNRPSLHEEFQFIAARYQLYWGDYRVRFKICSCLEQRVLSTPERRCNDCAQKAAFQLAICYRLGFGARKNDDACQAMLKRSMKREEDLEFQIGLIKQEKCDSLFREGTFLELYQQGQAVTLNSSHYYRENQQLEGLETKFREEILDVESVLGGLHELTWILKSILSMVLNDQGMWEETLELQTQVAEASERVFGQNNDNTLNSKANLALTCRMLGRWNEAETLITLVMKTRMNVLGYHHGFTLQSIEELASLYQSMGRWEKAEELLTEVVKAQETRLGPDHPNTLLSITNLASATKNLGQLSRAEELETHVVRQMTMVLGQDHPDTLISMGKLASTYRKQGGRWKECEDLSMQTLDTQKKILGEDHPETLISMNHLALVHQDQEHWEKSEGLFLQTWNKQKTVLGPDHQDTLTSLNNLALGYSYQQKWREAEELFMQVIEARQRVLGLDHPTTLNSMNSLAANYQDQGRWKEAEALYVQVTEKRKKILNEDHPNILNSMNNLASIYCNQRRYEDAENILVLVTEGYKRVYGQDHPETLSSCNNLAAAYMGQRRWDEAEMLFIQVTELRKQAQGPNHSATLVSMANLALAYKNQGHWEKAEDLLEQVISIQQGVPEPNLSHLLGHMYNLASCYQSRKQWESAERLLTQAVDGGEKLFGMGHPNTVSYMAALATVFWSQNRLQEAEELQMKVIKSRLELLGGDHPTTLITLHNLALTYRDQGRLTDAEVLLVAVTDKLRRALGDDDQDTVTSMKSLASVRDLKAELKG